MEKVGLKNGQDLESLMEKTKAWIQRAQEAKIREAQRYHDRVLYFFYILESRHGPFIFFKKNLKIYMDLRLLYLYFLCVMFEPYSKFI